MVYNYTPTYYSSLHDTITSLCKTMLPFSFKKRRFPALTADQKKLSKQQSENLKWQQESFHRILNLMGLHKEGILPEHEVSTFRSYLLDTLIASPSDQEAPTIIRDKLLFLQELFYAKCISGEEYHSSKRPLLQRLAVQGAEIEVRDVIVAGQLTEKSEEEEEEWSEINFKDEECLIGKESSNSNTKTKNKSPMKRIKGAASVIGFISPSKTGTNKGKKSTSDPTAEPLRPLDINNIPCNVNESGSFKENPFWVVPAKEKESEAQSILMCESSPPRPVKAEKERGSTEKVKKKPFRALFQRDQREGNGGHPNPGPEERANKSAKMQWGFDGFTKWKQGDREDEATPLAPLALGERSDGRASSTTTCHLVNSPIGEGPDTRLIKKKMHSNGSASDFFIDKVLGDNIKKELSRIQKELSTTNPNLRFSNDEMEAISTRLPVDKADLKKFFPGTWCDKYGDVVLDVVKKEFKDHIGEMESMRNANREKQRANSARWVTFEDDNNIENSHPNLYLHPQQSSSSFNISSNTKTTTRNHFFNDYSGEPDEKKLTESSYFHNPFWSPSYGSPK